MIDLELEWFMTFVKEKNQYSRPLAISDDFSNQTNGPSSGRWRILS